jgi:hypothetical protein
MEQSMRVSINGFLAVVGLAAGLAVASASAQNYTAGMDRGQWERLWDHFKHVQQQIDFQEQSGVLRPEQAWLLQKELGDTEMNSLWQRMEPNGANNTNIWAHLHHIHTVLGGAWDREFDRN